MTHIPVRRLSVFSYVILIENARHMFTEFLSEIKQSTHSVIESSL